MRRGKWEEVRGNERWDEKGGERLGSEERRYEEGERWVGDMGEEEKGAL